MIKLSRFILFPILKILNLDIFFNSSAQAQTNPRDGFYSGTHVQLCFHENYTFEVPLFSYPNLILLAYHSLSGSELRCY